MSNEIFVINYFDTKHTIVSKAYFVEFTNE
jgi:hypothetical protein